MVTLFVVVAVAVILFVAAYVATQDTEVLVDAPPDGADVELPAGRVVPEDLRAVRFGMVLRGYRMSEVDQVLDRMAEELGERDAHIADLERVLAEIVGPVVGEVEAQQAGPGDSTEAGTAAAALEGPLGVAVPEGEDADLTPLATAVEAHHPEAATGPAAVALPGSASDVTSFRLPLVAEPTVAEPTVAEPTVAEPTGPAPSAWRATDAASVWADDEILEPFGAETLVEEPEPAALAVELVPAPGELGERSSPPESVVDVGQARAAVDEEPELWAEAGPADDADEHLLSQDADRWHVTPIGVTPLEHEARPTAHLEDDLLFPEVSPAESAAPGAEPARDAEDRES